METVQRTRGEIIEELIDQDITDIMQEHVQNSDTSWLQSILYDGFEGYANMPDNTLVNEYKERCLSDEQQVQLVPSTQ